MIKTCTKEKPFTTKRDSPKTRWQHDALHEVGEQEDGYPGGDIVTYQCDNCGVRFRSELPQ